ncbi:NUP50 (Nucleoporin 50 kDa) [Novymonas esmeraldas]|uniref:NUP50 (Nucleoporin 50 kDa) n=1 Tax=Novymonas esmeraldas TaxID=1808958 RepID=A0AAW0F4X3_9TRYP
MSGDSRKRVATTQLTRDDGDGDRRGDDDFVTAPQIADSSEMSTRRVVRVRRGPDEPASARSFANTPSLFKDIAGPTETAPTTSKWGIGANEAGKGAPTPFFSFGATTAASSSSSTAAAPASSAAPTATAAPSSGFSFGSGGTAGPATTAAAGTPPIAFSFGGQPSSGGGGSNNNAAAGTASGFSFGTGVAAAPTTAGVEAGSGFSFGFPPSTSSSQPPNAAETATAAAESAAPKTATATATAPVFGSGSFNFGVAVNSFVEARKKLHEESKDAVQEAGDGDSANDGDDAPKGDGNGTGFGSEIVEPTARDVVASGPSKLFLFEKGDDGAAGHWVERGAGDAKLVAEEPKTAAGARVHRLLVRSGYSLNATLGKNLFALSKTEAKHLILAVATSAGPRTYLLKFTGPNAETNTATFSEAIKKVMQEVEKAA